ncbi:hypothetical protein [Rhodococcus gannanensis]|uniref:WXG100 family type VII secretion target n=1 Tax=Rhodococcus gannanensis TaxID=1960308 RepID=A0ABW4P064_9NOCA
MASMIVTSNHDTLFGVSADVDSLAARISDAIHTAGIEGSTHAGRWEGAASQQFHAKLGEFISLGYDLADQLHSGAATLRQLAWGLAAIGNVPLSIFGA